MLGSATRMSSQAHESSFTRLQLRDREWMKNLDQVLSHHAPTDQQLAVLLLLRTRRDHQWTAIGVSLELQLPLAISEEALEYLAEEGFLYSTGGNPPAFAYVHLSDSVDARVQSLALAQEIHRRGRQQGSKPVSPRKQKSPLRWFVELCTRHRHST